MTQRNTERTRPLLIYLQPLRQLDIPAWSPMISTREAQEIVRSLHQPASSYDASRSMLFAATAAHQLGIDPQASILQDVAGSLQGLLHGELAKAVSQRSPEITTELLGTLHVLFPEKLQDSDRRQLYDILPEQAMNIVYDSHIFALCMMLCPNLSASEVANKFLPRNTYDIVWANMMDLLRMRERQPLSTNSITDYLEQAAFSKLIDPKRFQKDVTIFDEQWTEAFQELERQRKVGNWKRFVQLALAIKILKDPTSRIEQGTVLFGKEQATDPLPSIRRSV